MSNFFYPNQPSIHDPRRYHPGPEIRSYSPSHMYPSSLKASPQLIDNRPIQGYGGYGDPMGYERRRDISPMRYAPMEGGRPYEYRNIPLQEPSIPLIELQESRNMGYGSPIRNKELSPLIRLMKANEGSPVMYRNHLEGANSWDKLIRRPEESKIERFHKMENWKKELDVQIQEQKVKKQVEEEEKRNKEIKDENRYKKQLQELMVKNHKDFEHRKMREQGHKKQQGGGEKPYKVQHYDHHGQNYYVPPNHNNHLRPDYYLPPGYDEKRGKSLQKHGHYSMEIDDDNRPRQRINGFIDHLKAEIIHGQKVFMDGIKDVKYNHKKPNQFRNLAERNLLGAQNGGIVRGGAFLKADYHQMTPEESFGGSLESDRRYRKYDSYDVYQQPADKYKEDADQFFAQLTHFGHVNEKSKIKKGGRPSAKNLQLPEISVNGSELRTTVSDKEVVKKQQVKPEIKEFKIVKETHLKVEDKTIKKVSSEVKIKVENEIPIVKEKKSDAVVAKEEKPIVVIEKPPVQVQVKEEKRKESEDSKKTESVAEEIEEEVKKPEVESKEEITNSKSEFEGSMKINQHIAQEMNLKQASPHPEEIVEKLKKTQGSASTMKPVVPEISTSLAQLERAETPATGSMANIVIPNPKRENTPIENRKIKNFNLFKNSRRGSVETVDLDAFEDLLEKEVKRGKMPTFKSPREETEVLFGGFDVGKKADRSKRPKKSIANIKSGVTLRALAQVISNDEVELKHFQQKKADPMAKLDSMLDRLFG